MSISRRWDIRFPSLALALSLPLLGGAQGDGCAANSRSPAPDVTGEWRVDYDDILDVELTIGGTVYSETLGAGGGVITIDHEGRPLMFDLDCDRTEIVCPSEAWPTQVSIEQRDRQFEHQMIVNLPTQSCSGPIVPADPEECGEGTPNPDCEDVCDGDITVRNEERFGVIGERGDTFRLYLGAGVATNGFNCALLAASVADGDIVSTGTPHSEDWYAEELTSGLVTVGYAGGCLWVGDPDMDAQLEALVIGASLVFRTGFVGSRIE